MGATYTRQSTFTDGDVIDSDLFNNEYDQLLAAFASSTGHTHDGTAGEGGAISNLLSDSIVFGTNAGDITLTWNGGSNDGVLTWMEDEDYFQFSDDLLISTNEKIQFRDTAIYINSSADGQLDIVADTEIQIAATTIDINGAVALNGAITGATNITLSGELDAATLDISGNADIDGNLDVGGNLTVTGTTTFNGGTLTLGDSASDNVVFGADVDSNIIPDDDNTYDLGSASQEWRNLFIDGTANIDSLVADTADINGGTVDGAVIGGSSAAAITGTAITGTSFVIGSASINENDLESIDDITAGTVSASKAAVVDSNKDITGFRNITLTGELDAGSLDISGNADIDGTLEADAITVNGTALAEVISDTVGAMVSSNTESGITVTYQDADNTLDFTIGTLNQNTTGSAATLTTARTIGGVSFNGSANINLPGVNASGNQNTSGTAAIATTVTITDNENTNENNAIVFTAGGDLDGGNLGLESDGDLKYNPSTGTLSATNISVSGTLSTVDSVTMSANNAVVFEGATADAHETTLTVVDATADRTITLPNVSGTVPVLAVASNTQITSTPEELNALDGITAVVGELNALDIGSTAIGTAVASKAVILDSNKDYTGLRNLTITGELDAATLDISGAIDVAGTANLDVVDIDGAVDMASTLSVGGLLTVNAGENSSHIKVGNSRFMTIKTGTDGTYADAITKFSIDSTAGQFSFFNSNTTELLNISAAGAATFNAGVTATDALFNGSIAGRGLIIDTATEGVTDNVAILNAQHSAGILSLKTGGSEAMRIDSSGNLLVGQSSSTAVGAGNTTTGFSIRGDGGLYASRSSGPTITANGNADGDIIKLYKSGSAVGSIGTAGGQIHVASTGGATYTFEDGAFFGSDADRDLGKSNRRWRNGYFSGNIGIGTSSPTRQMSVENTLASGGGSIGITSSDSSTSGSLGIIHFGNSTDSSLASIGGLADGSTSAGALLFKTEAAGGAIEERMRIDSSGNVGIIQDLNIGNNDSSNPVSKLRFGATQYGAADIRPFSVGHKVGLDFYTDGTGDNTINPTFAMRINEAGNVGIGTTSPTGSGTVLHLNGSGTVADFHMTNTTSGVASTDGLIMRYSGLNAEFLNREAGANIFYTSATERMRIDSSGDVYVGKSSGNATVQGTVLYNSGQIYVTASGSQAVLLTRKTNDGEIILFYREGTNVGNISVTGSSTAYNTSSDYRLKENVVDLTGASARVNQLDVKRFNFISDDTNTLVDGFLAHEVATVVPEAITGAKDAMKDEEYEVTAAVEEVTDDDGNVTTEAADAVMGTRNVPNYQGIDQSKLVPLLTAALQEALAKIDAMETRLTALEG